MAGEVLRCDRWARLGDRFGPYETAKRRYRRWIEAGVFDRIFEGIATDPDMEQLAIHATVIRANAQAAGARRKRGDTEPRLLGHSRGGFGSRIHAVVDVLGLPIRFELGPGQQNDMAPACDLIRALPAEQILAERAFDAKSLHELIVDPGGLPSSRRAATANASTPVIASPSADSGEKRVIHGSDHEYEEAA